MKEGRKGEKREVKKLRLCYIHGPTPHSECCHYIPQKCTSKNFKISKTEKIFKNQNNHSSILTQIIYCDNWNLSQKYKGSLIFKNK